MEACFCIEAVTKKAKAKTKDYHCQSQQDTLWIETMLPGVFHKMGNVPDDHYLCNKRNPLPENLVEDVFSGSFQKSNQSHLNHVLPLLPLIFNFFRSHKGVLSLTSRFFSLLGFCSL